jgi:hypothetical protein
MILYDDNGVLYQHTNEVPEWVAREVAAVGIHPAIEQHPVGHVYTIAGQTFVITGYTTREAFLEAFHNVTGRIADPPPEVQFFHLVSTD